MKAVFVLGALAACSGSSSTATPAPGEPPASGQRAPTPTAAAPTAATPTPPAPEPAAGAPGPFEVTVHKVEQLAELGGKPAAKGTFWCVQLEVKNRGASQEQFAPPHFVVDPVGTQVALAREATEAYAPAGWDAERPKLDSFKPGQVMKRVACFDAALASSQRARLVYAYGGYGAEHPPWRIDLALPR